MAGMFDTIKKGLSYLNGGASTGYSITDMKSGNDLVKYTSFLSLDVRAEAQVVKGAIEEGSFASYNKVMQPAEIDVQLGVAGTENELQEVLKTLEKYRHSTDLIAIAIPEGVYRPVSLESFSYARKREDGINVLWLDLSFVQIKQVKAQTTNAKLGGRKSSGKVQPKQEESALYGLMSWKSGK